MAIRLHILLAAILASVPSNQAWAATNPTLELGRSYFQSHNYPAAENCFRRAAEMAFDNAEAHYWYATVLAKRLKGQLAVKEYQACLALNPSPTLALYCRQALSAYHCPAPTAAAQAPPPAVVQAAAAPSDPVLDQERSRALARIQSDTLSEIQTLQTRDAKLQAAKKLEGDLAAQRMLDEGRRRMRQMQRESQNGGINVRVPYSASQISHVEDEYKHRADYAKDMMLQEAQAAHDRIEQRQSMLEESAANLQEQLNQPDSAHGAILQPLGSNLFVRNYLVSPQDEADRNNPIVPAKAVALSRKPAVSSGINSEKAQAGKLPGLAAGSAKGHAGPQIETSVKGILIPEESP